MARTSAPGPNFGMARRRIRITHLPTGEILAEGPVGWGITPFEGNYYILKKYLKTGGFKANFLPGLCWYKFLYVWMDFMPQSGSKVRNMGWFYWLPNPLFPFVAFRLGLPARHPQLSVDVWEESSAGP